MKIEDQTQDGNIDTSGLYNAYAEDTDTQGNEELASHQYELNAHHKQSASSIYKMSEIGKSRHHRYQTQTENPKKQQYLTQNIKKNDYDSVEIEHFITFMSEIAYQMGE